MNEPERPPVPLFSGLESVMSETSEEILRPGEEILLRTRPLVRSFWVYALGVVICGGGPFIRENPPLSPTSGLVLASVFALIILIRWSNVYTLTNRRIMMRGGLIARDTMAINLSNIRDVETHQGYSSRLVGTGQLLIRSRVPQEHSIMVYGLVDPDGLKRRILALAAEAGAEPASEGD